MRTLRQVLISGLADGVVLENGHEKNRGRTPVGDHGRAYFFFALATGLEADLGSTLADGSGAPIIRFVVSIAGVLALGEVLAGALAGAFTGFFSTTSGFLAAAALAGVFATGLDAAGAATFLDGFAGTTVLVVAFEVGLAVDLAAALGLDMMFLTWLVRPRTRWMTADFL